MDTRLNITGFVQLGLREGAIAPLPNSRGSAHMPGDPKACRRHAARCAELAVVPHTPQLRTAFLELCKNWEKLAIQLEDAFAQLSESEVIRSDVRESHNLSEQLSSFPILKQ
jgi:hypothetical protein